MLEHKASCALESTVSYDSGEVFLTRVRNGEPIAVHATLRSQSLIRPIDSAVFKEPRATSNFFDTASFSVTLEVEPAGSVPEPETAIMLALGLIAFRAARGGSRQGIQT